MALVLRLSPVPLAAALLVLGTLLSGVGTPAGALAQPGWIPLQCRLGKGPWQDCRMRVEQVGQHWWLVIGERQVEFRHDGKGTVSMQQDRGGWRSVSSRWEEDRNLCWDGLCARGDLPLD